MPSYDDHHRFYDRQADRNYYDMQRRYDYNDNRFYDKIADRNAVDRSITDRMLADKAAYDRMLQDRTSNDYAADSAALEMIMRGDMNDRAILDKLIEQKLVGDRIANDARLRGEVERRIGEMRRLHIANTQPHPQQQSNNFAADRAALDMIARTQLNDRAILDQLVQSKLVGQQLVQNLQIRAELERRIGEMRRQYLATMQQPNALRINGPTGPSQPLPQNHPANHAQDRFVIGNKDADNAAKLVAGVIHVANALNATNGPTAVPLGAGGLAAAGNARHIEIANKGPLYVPEKKEVIRPGIVHPQNGPNPLGLDSDQQKNVQNFLNIVKMIVGS